MKKSKLFVFFVLALLLIGCSNGEPKSDETNPGIQNDKSSEAAISNDDDADDAEKNVSEISIYYLSNEDVFTSKTISWKNQDENQIWEELVNEKMLTDECKIIDFKVNEAEKSIDLDVNTAFGDLIRRMGTSGESAMLASVVNTYLEAYNCEKIKISEEGQDLVTNNLLLDTYMEKRVHE